MYPHTSHVYIYSYTVQCCSVQPRVIGVLNLLPTLACLHIQTFLVDLFSGDEGTPSIGSIVMQLNTENSFNSSSGVLHSKETQFMNKMLDSLA